MTAQLHTQNGNSPSSFATICVDVQFAYFRSRFPRAHINTRFQLLNTLNMKCKYQGTVAWIPTVYNRKELWINYNILWTRTSDNC